MRRDASGSLASLPAMHTPLTVRTASQASTSGRMTPASPPAPRPYRRLRVPAFYPVPTRTRRDG